MRRRQNKGVHESPRGTEVETPNEHEQESAAGETGPEGREDSRGRVLVIGLMLVLVVGIWAGLHYYRLQNPYPDVNEPSTTTTLLPSVAESLREGGTIELIGQDGVFSETDIAESLAADLGFERRAAFELRYEEGEAVLTVYVSGGVGCERAVMSGGEVSVEELAEQSPCRPEEPDQGGLAPAEQALALLTTPDAEGLALIERAAATAAAEGRTLSDVLSQFYAHGLVFSEVAGAYEHEVSVHQAADASLWAAVSDGETCLWSSVDSGEVSTGSYARPAHGCSAEEAADSEG